MLRKCNVVRWVEDSAEPWERQYTEAFESKTPF
jgi:hypothetical protein